MSILYEPFLFEDFPIVIGPILIPSNVSFYRGHDQQYPVIGERPQYFSQKEVASGYLRSNKHKLQQYQTTKYIKVYDIRFIRMILKEILNHHPPYDDDIYSSIHSLTLSLGLCSLQKQIQLIQLRYPKGLIKEKESIQKFAEQLHKSNYTQYPFIANIIEPEGIRFAETNNDFETFSILQGLFQNQIDGIISPRLYSPFFIQHQGISPPEIIIFNPSKSGISLVENTKNIHQQLDLNTLLQIDHYIKIPGSFGKLNPFFFPKTTYSGGSKKQYKFDIIKFQNYIQKGTKLRDFIEKHCDITTLPGILNEKCCPVLPWTYSTKISSLNSSSISLMALSK